MNVLICVVEHFTIFRKEFAPDVTCFPMSVLAL
jgi:hypothetical protein